MAVSARRLRNKLGPQNTCSICMNIFDNPHSFPCRHTFCYDCGQDCLKFKNECPECRAPVWNRDFTYDHKAAMHVAMFGELLKDAEMPLSQAVNKENQAGQDVSPAKSTDSAKSMLDRIMSVTSAMSDSCDHPLASTTIKSTASTAGSKGSSHSVPPVARRLTRSQHSTLTVDNGDAGRSESSHEEEEQQPSMVPATMSLPSSDAGQPRRSGRLSRTSTMNSRVTASDSRAGSMMSVTTTAMPTQQPVGSLNSNLDTQDMLALPEEVVTALETELAEKMKRADALEKQLQQQRRAKAVPSSPLATREGASHTTATTTAAQSPFGDDGSKRLARRYTRDTLRVAPSRTPAADRKSDAGASASGKRERPPLRRRVTISSQQQVHEIPNTRRSTRLSAPRRMTTTTTTTTTTPARSTRSRNPVTPVVGSKKHEPAHTQSHRTPRQPQQQQEEEEEAQESDNEESEVANTVGEEAVVRRGGLRGRTSSIDTRAPRKRARPSVTATSTRHTSIETDDTSTRKRPRRGPRTNSEGNTQASEIPGDSMSVTSAGASSQSRRAYSSLPIAPGADAVVLLVTKGSAGAAADKADRVVRSAARLGVHTVKEWSPEVTHVVVPTKLSSYGTISAVRTGKYLCAVAARQYVVSLDWVTTCVRDASFEVDPMPYVVGGDAMNRYGAMRAIKQRQRDLPLLFADCTIYLSHLPSAEHRKQFRLIAETAGAQVEDDTDLPALMHTANRSSFRKGSGRSSFIVVDPATLASDPGALTAVAGLIQEQTQALDGSLSTKRFSGLSLVSTSWLPDCISKYRLLTSRYDKWDCYAVVSSSVESV